MDANTLSLLAALLAAVLVLGALFVRQLLKAHSLLRELELLRREHQRAGEELETLRQELSDSRTKREDLAARTAVLERELAVLQEKADQAARSLEERDGEAESLKASREELRERVATLERDLSLREESLKERETRLEELKAQFAEQARGFKDEFKALSQEILEARSKALKESNDSGIGSIVEPLKKQLEEFQTRVNVIHSEQVRDQGRLDKQLQALGKLNEGLSSQAENLAKALRNEKKTLGNWGEIQVERLLEGAGLVRDRDYRREDSFRTVDGDLRRPDFVLYLPEDKHIIIDSKVSLNDYIDSVNAVEGETAELALKAHVARVDAHIKALSEKDYSSLIGVNSPDFVLLFMPIETAYLAALSCDTNLFSRAYDKKIAIVTPNTLLPIVRTVASLWQIDKQNKNTQALAEMAAQVHRKVNTFAKRFQDVAVGLGRAQDSYDAALKTLTGRGSLIGLAGRFEDLGVKVKESLPRELLEESRVEPGEDGTTVEEIALKEPPVDEE